LASDKYLKKQGLFNMVKKKSRKQGLNTSKSTLKNRARSSRRGTNVSADIEYKQVQENHILLREAMETYGKSESTIRRWYRDPDVNVDVFRNLEDPNDFRNFVDPVQIQRMCAKSQRSSMSMNSRTNSSQTPSKPVQKAKSDDAPVYELNSKVAILTERLENKEEILAERDKRISLLTRQNEKLEEELTRLHDHHDATLKYLNRMSLPANTASINDDTSPPLSEVSFVDERQIPMPSIPTQEEIEAPIEDEPEEQLAPIPTLEEVHKATHNAAKQAVEEAMEESKSYIEQVLEDQRRKDKMAADLEARNAELKKKRSILNPLGVAERVVERVLR
jgi:hypothetical protein